MSPHLLSLFVREINRQVSFGLRAAKDLFRSLDMQDTEAVWYSVQSLLVAVGNTSKLLWPSKSGDALRGIELRRVLELEDDSPLQSKRFRNHFEHFDERLDEWGPSLEGGMVVDSNIGDLGLILGGVKPEYVRNFDPSTGVLTFRGELYELKPIIDALVSLHDKTKKLGESR